MDTRSARTAGALALVALLQAAGAASVGDPAGDVVEGQPWHDLLLFEVEETATELRFTVGVAGAHRPPVAGVDEVRISFRLLPAALAGLGAGGTAHTVSATDADAYGVFRVGGFGYTLPRQPAYGSPNATWHVPKAYLDATAASRPAAGDVLGDVAVETVVLGAVVDRAEHPDVVLAKDQPEGLRLHLRGEALGARSLQREAAEDRWPATAALFDGVLQAEWATPPLRKELPLREPSAFLWLSASTTTPVIADEELAVELYAVDALGQRTLLARRAEALSATGETNLYLAPGVPQRMPFQLTPLVDAVPAGAALVLHVRVGGFLAEESGPLLVHYDSERFDSFLSVGQGHAPRADRAACPAGNAHAELPKARC